MLIILYTMFGASSPYRIVLMHAGEIFQPTAQGQGITNITMAHYRCVLGQSSI